MEKVGQTTEDRRLSLQPVLCQGACGLAPVMGVDQDNHGGMALRRVEGFSTGIGER
jgi:NADH:ubiquinone oxidoreductase subunit E